MMFRNYRSRYVFNFFLSIFLPAAFHACSVQSKFAEQDVVIELERTRCMGTCPVYHIRINNDGMVLYEGKEHVARLGLYRSELPDSLFQEIIDRFQAINFYQLRDVYITNISDQPTTYITFRYEGGYKRIMDYYNAPDALRELENFIDHSLENLSFRKAR